MSVDYNEADKARAHRQSTSSHKSAKFYANTGYSKDSKNNNKYTGFTVSGGGQPSASTIKGLDGLHKTKTVTPVDTSHNKDKTVWSGGGNTSTKNVHGNPCVSPE